MGSSAEKRAVAPSGMFRQRGRGKRHWVAQHLLWDDKSGKGNGSRRSGARVGNAWGRPQENAQSLPLECSVRGGEARDTGSLSTCSVTTRRRKKRTSAQRLEGWQRVGSSVALIVRGRQMAVLQTRAEYGNAETSVAPSGMIRRMERDVAAKRSVAPSGMICQRERQARYSSNNSSLTLVLIKGLSRRRFRVVVRREERERYVGRLVLS